MPRLPDLTALGNRPAPRGNRAIVSQDTTAVGKAIAGLGKEIGAFGEAVAQRQDEQAVFEARRKLNDWERDTIYDPTTGAINKRGKDALELGKAMPEIFDKFAGEVSASLTSNRQRKVFQEMAAARRDQVLSWTDRHVLKERDAYETTQYQADMISSIDRAVTLAAEPDKAMGELAVMNARTVGVLKGKGASEEAIAVAVRDNSDKVHAAVIGSMMADGRSTDAQAYLTKNAASMQADTIGKVRLSLKEGLARERAQATADELMATGADLKTGLETIRAKLSGTDEQAAVQEFKARLAERDAAQAQAKKEVTDQAWKVITNGGSKKQIPIAMWNALPADEQRQINDYTEAKWRRAKSDAEGTSNHETPERVRTYIGLRDMAANEPDRFAALDPERYAPYLTRQHRDKLIEIRAGIDKGDAKVQQLDKITQSTLKMLDQSMAAAGIKTTGKRTQKQIDDADLFKGRLMDTLMDASKVGKVDADAARKIGLGLLREKVEAESGFFGGRDKKREYQIPPEEAGKFIAKPFKEIPTAMRADIIADQFPNAPKSIYGDREPILTDEEAKRVELIYTNGVARGVFK